MKNLEKNFKTILEEIKPVLLHSDLGKLVKMLRSTKKSTYNNGKRRIRNEANKLQNKG